jgi:hypothetical protein
MVAQAAMSGAENERAGALRLRRARREDIPALLPVVGGPAHGRLRALRRILKTLVADVYVLDDGGTLRGVVAVLYRRSVAHGGLVATIDLLALLPGCPDEGAAETVRRLVECALSRARRRGCIAADSGLGEPFVVEALEAAGLQPVATQRVLSLRTPPPDAKSGVPEPRGDA